MLYYRHLGTTAILLRPDDPDKEFHLFCFSLLQTSDQPITCQQLLGVGSRRPAGVEVEGKRGELRSHWLLEHDDEFAAAGKLAGVMETFF